MKIEQKKDTVIIKYTLGDMAAFFDKVVNEHYNFQSYNLIIDLSKYGKTSLTPVKLFVDLSKAHKNLKKSFVLVATNIDFSKVTQKLIVVPTLQEAHDIIEMEEIERDLNF